MSVNTALTRAFGALPHIDLGARPIDQLLTSPNGRRDVEALLPEYLGDQRWFTGKGRELVDARLGSMVPLSDGSALGMIDATYAQGAGERYAHLLTTRPAADVDPATLRAPMATVSAADGTFVLTDGMADAGAVRGLVELMHAGATQSGRGGAIQGRGGAAMDDAMRGHGALSATPIDAHSSNTLTSVQMPDGSSQVVKLVRRHDAQVEPGTPTRALDVVKGEHLTNDTQFRNTPRVFGSIDHVDEAGVPRTVSVASEFVDNDGDAWTHALDSVRTMLGHARSGDVVAADAAIADYAQLARTQGQRLGELHVALAQGGRGSEFRSEAPSAAQLGRERARMAKDADDALAAVRASGIDVPGGRSVDGLERALRRTLEQEDGAATGRAPWIHGHGDFHLGQMLTQGRDVQLLDLEGAPILSLAERWERADPLVDVARNRSSFEYAGRTAFGELGGVDPGVRDALDVRARTWAQQAGDAFVDGWREATRGSDFAPADARFGSDLRRAELANALYETRYELGSRPDWVGIPLERVARLTGA